MDVAVPSYRVESRCILARRDRDDACRRRRPARSTRRRGRAGRPSRSCSPIPSRPRLTDEPPSPEALRDVDDAVLRAMRIALERHGGTVEKFIGDAVMAVFGLPVRHEDDALRAIRAAADMQEALPELNRALPRGMAARASQPHRRQHRRGHRRRRQRPDSAS